MPRVVHFELSAQDPDRLQQFYRGVFAWEFTSWGGDQEYWLIKTGPDSVPGIDGGMGRRNDDRVGGVNSIAVDSLEQTLALIEKHGGQAVTPKMEIPGVGTIAYFDDPEGNRGCAVQFAPRG